MCVKGILWQFTAAPVPHRAVPSRSEEALTMAEHPRVLNKSLWSKIMPAEAAAALIPNGAIIATSGFTGAGYPKAVPLALAKRAVEDRTRGKPLRLNVLTGASTGPELDQALALTDAVAFRFPYNGDATMRERINAGQAEYQDMHLSHAGTLVRYGYYGKIDYAIIEVLRIREDGSLVFSSSSGMNTAYLDKADKYILEVNEWQDERLEGMHDVYLVSGKHGERKPIPVMKTDDRIGSPYMPIDVSKVAAVVISKFPDRNAPFKKPEQDHMRIAQHILDFLDGEVKSGRLPNSLTPLQSGVGNIANAVLVGLNEGQERFIKNIDRYRKQIILRPQDVSNNPEVIRRLGCIAMNGFVEADIYGHVNSTHIVGKGIENGIGGSGDFARNSAYTIFMSPPTAKDGKISAIVPFATHIDHTEHDTMGFVTEFGFADLRAKSPKQRAKEIIEKCAHPDYRPLLWDYFKRSCKSPSAGLQSPHMFTEAFGFHNRYLQTGDMRPKK